MLSVFLHPSVTMRAPNPACPWVGEACNQFQLAGRSRNAIWPSASSMKLLTSLIHSFIPECPLNCDSLLPQIQRGNVRPRNQSPSSSRGVHNLHFPGGYAAKNARKRTKRKKRNTKGNTMKSTKRQAPIKQTQIRFLRQKFDFLCVLYLWGSAKHFKTCFLCL